MASLQDNLDTWRARVDATLDRWLPDEHTPPHALHKAMRYSTLDGGKRVRAALVYSAGSALGAAAGALDGPAAAVELIHAYSLIHDDLPCMDNDDLRRGKPTCHKAFDEATALLAGDTLQALAFEILAADPALEVDAGQRIKMISILTRASGWDGMAGGQAIDLAATGKTLKLAELENMHRMKTGALIRASVALGALAAGCENPALLAQLDDYADHLGLMFQIVDDILDVEGDTETLGKPAGSDQAANKATYPALLGLETARERARAEHQQCLESLGDLGDNGALLAELADYVLNRSR